MVKKAKTKAWDFGWLALCLATASYLYFSTITRFSIWHDESFTAMLINYDWSELVRRAALDVHPPVYYFILKLWTDVFGTSLLAMRSFSALCMLSLIVVAYYFVKHLWDVRVARLASVFLVLAPFIVRYAQEARMYALVALLILSATYLLVLAAERSNLVKLYLYAILMALAIYCHYYALFVLPAHWLYVLLHTHRAKQPRRNISLKNWNWWGANALIVLLLGPWLPTAFKQFTSIQGAFWIPPVNLNTVFSTLTNFMIYQDAAAVHGYLKVWMLLAAACLVVLVPLAIYLNRMQRINLILVTSYAFMAPLCIFILSLPPLQPIYNNRYFSLTCVAFYILLAVLIFSRPLERYKMVQIVSAAAVLVTLGIGAYHVRQVGNFNPDRQEKYSMGQLSQIFNSGYQTGDAIVSTNLSTYFDVRYYNRNPTTVGLKVGEAPNGVGNTALIYDRQDILVYDYNQLHPASNRVWLITDAQDEHPEVPSNWHQLSRSYQDYAAVIEYTIN